MKAEYSIYLVCLSVIVASLLFQVVSSYLSRRALSTLSLRDLLLVYEEITEILTDLNCVINDIAPVELIDLYEESVISIESTLESTVGFAKTNPTQGELQKALDLANICHKKVLHCRNLIIAEKSKVEMHCYICSLPFSMAIDAPDLVPLKVAGESVRVLSCLPCKKILQNEKKIQVLNFLIDGKKYHWSKVPGYVPSEKYWNFNKRDSKT